MEIEKKNEGIKGASEILKNLGVENKEEVGIRIMAELIKSYQLERDRTEEKIGGFSNNIGDKEGLNTMLIGGTSMLLLVNNFGYDLDTNPEANAIIIENMQRILSYVNDNGFDFTPYVPNTRLKNVFNQCEDGLYSYFSIDTITWFISYLVQLRRAIIDERLKFSDKATSDELSLKIIDKLGNSLLNVEKAAIDCLWPDEEGKPPKAKPAAWGVLNTSKTPSLYYTTLVIEVLSEIDDNIIVSDENLRKNREPDYVLIDALGSKLIEKEDGSFYLDNKTNDKELDGYQGVLTRFFKSKKYCGEDGLMQNTSRWIWNKYRQQILDGKLEIDQHYDNNEVYYYIYIMEILTLSYTELFASRREVGEVIEAGMFYVDKKIKQLKENKITSKRNFTYRAETVGLDGNSKIERELDSELKKYLLFGPSLTPLRIKLGSMYAFYFTRYPDKKMTGELETLLESKNRDNWYWDDTEFSLQATEKSIEALVDFFNYYEAFEQQLVRNAEEVDKARKNIRNQLEKQERANLVESIRLELQDEYQETIDGLKSEYQFQHHVKAFIDKCIEEKLEEELEKKLKEKLAEGIANDLIAVFDRIIEYNINESVTDNQTIRTLSDKIRQLTISNFYATAFDKQRIQNRSISRNILSIFETDYKLFLQELFNYVKKHIEEQKEVTGLPNLVTKLKNKELL